MSPLHYGHASIDIVFWVGYTISQRDITEGLYTIRGREVNGVGLSRYILNAQTPHTHRHFSELTGPLTCNYDSKDSDMFKCCFIVPPSFIINVTAQWRSHDSIVTLRFPADLRRTKEHQKNTCFKLIMDLFQVPWLDADQSVSSTQRKSKIGWGYVVGDWFSVWSKSISDLIEVKLS